MKGKKIDGRHARYLEQRDTMRRSLKVNTRLGTLDLRGNKIGWKRGLRGAEQRCRFCEKEYETELHLIAECDGMTQDRESMWIQIEREMGSEYGERLKEMRAVTRMSVLLGE